MSNKLWAGMACLGMAGLYGCGAPTVAAGSASENAGAAAIFAGSVAVPIAGGAGTAGTPSLLDNGVGLVDAGPVFVPDETEPVKGECGATSLSAKQISVQTEVKVESLVTTVKPVVLYIMFDQSLSMSWSNLWDPAVAAMKSFVTDAKSAGIGVGLQYFPLSGGGASCSTGSGYSTPAVAIGQLPGQAKAFQDSLTAHDPNGVGTPIEGALRGVTEFCKKYQTDHAEQQCVAVLVTDGKPEFASGCSENADTLANIAGAAHIAGVTTFAVGLKGADFGLLDKIAKQGGAPDCDANASAYACDVSTSADKLGVALTSIRDSIVTTEVHTEIVTHLEETKLPCEWEIPSPPDGHSFDRDKVNIRFTAAEVDTTFVRVASSSACRVNGWHFDDAQAPKRLIACPETCNRIKATVDAKIDVLLGCATLFPE